MNGEQNIITYKIEVVSKELFEKVVDENRQLKSELSEIQIKCNCEYMENLKHKELISKHVETIEELRQENERLKKIIAQLQQKINDLERRDKLKEKQIEKLINQKYIKNIIKGCQDLNKEFYLEKNLQQHSQILFDMRDKRNEFSHLILDKDDSNMKAYKQKKIIEKLGNLSPDQIRIFDRRVNSKTLRQEIINYCNGHLNPIDESKISQSEKDDIDEWFDD